jgi:hypothetical protein
LDEINGFLGSNKISSHNTESAMQATARGSNRINHHYAALASLLVMCLAVCTVFSATAASMDPSEVTLQLKPLKAAVNEDENIGMALVFTGGARETTLILPMGADPSGILTYRATEVASGREWIGSRRDSRSFAADAPRRLAAGERLELHHDALWFEGAENPMAGNLPAGTYRIVATYDEARTFRPKHRGSRMIRSEPVEIVVTGR